ncbi:Odorant receptor [Sergentomyia squamirostris]
MAPGSFSVSECRKYLLARCAFVGLDVFVQDGRRNIMYYLCFIVPWTYMTCCFYTLYVLQNDTTSIMQCLVVWGAAGQVNIKINLAYWYRKDLRQIYDFIRKKQESAEYEPEVEEIYKKWAKRHYLVQKLLVYVLNNNLFMLSFYAILEAAIYNRRKYIVICNIPGLSTDPDVFPDYEFQSLFHIGCLFVGVNELVAMDGLLTYFIINGACLAETLILEVKRMSSLIEKDSNKNFSDEDTTRYIRRLCLLHREYIDYVNRLEGMYNRMFLMKFGTYAISGSVGLYAARITDWYAVYAIVFSTVFQLFFFCSFGSVIENKNTEILDVLYESNWTGMSVKNRRMILFMIQRAKTVETISVGHLSPLNLETGMSTYKVLYSYFLLLKDAVNV